MDQPSPILVSAIPPPAPSTPSRSGESARSELFTPPVQAALFTALFTLALIVAWQTIRVPGPVERESSPTLLTRVDVNRAGRAELMLLPGIGPGLADRILQHREVHGPFDGLADLAQVPGIGPMTLEKLRPRIALSWTDASASRSSAVSLRSMSGAGARTSRISATVSVIDPNRASFQDLQKLPGIGPKLAQRMIDAREARPFETLADLRRVPGIGPKTLEKLAPFVVFGESKSVVALD